VVITSRAVCGSGASGKLPDLHSVLIFTVVIQSSDPWFGKYNELMSQRKYKEKYYYTVMKSLLW
jgi:hypothetical protein